MIKKTLKVCPIEQLSSVYEIVIGFNMFDYIANEITSDNSYSHYVIIADDNVSKLYGEMLLNHLSKKTTMVDIVEFPAGENSKTSQTVNDVVGKLLSLGVDRKSVLIALGGGVTGDLVGYIASIFMRGISLIHVPTSLLAQVDSSIGGKTAINLPQGKNLLGTFYRPKYVFIDVKCLDTLPENEYQNGLAEILKYGVIDSNELFLKLENSIDLILSKNKSHLEEIITDACGIKKNIIEIDEKEKDQRRVLNFGHTLGHAIEQASEYNISHGNAIAIGMIAISRISNKLHGFPERDLERIERLISTFGLANFIPSYLKNKDILNILKHDKKKEMNQINYVMLKKIGSPFISDNVSDELLVETIEELKGPRI